MGNICRSKKKSSDDVTVILIVLKTTSCFSRSIICSIDEQREIFSNYKRSWNRREEKKNERNFCFFFLHSLQSISVLFSLSFYRTFRIHFNQQYLSYDNENDNYLITDKTFLYITKIEETSNVKISNNPIENVTTTRND